MNLILAGNVNVAKSLKPEITIEAEWGDDYIEGSKLSLNHHGKNSNNPPPCVAKIDRFTTNVRHLVDTVVFSHIDLDSIGGYLNVLNYHVWSDHQSFWELAAFVDVNGPHKIQESDASQEDIDRLYAWWDWSSKNRCPRIDRTLPSKEQFLDIHEYVMQCGTILHFIMDNDKNLLENGRQFKQNELKLNKDSFVKEKNGVILRKSNKFVNHLYLNPNGVIGKIVVAFNTESKSVTISKADSDNDVDCCGLIQTVFGKKAGGHKGIAGSPRDKECVFDDAVRLFEIVNLLNKKVFS